MKITLPSLIAILLITITGCSKTVTTTDPALIIPIPNGDFENWDGWPSPLDWRTNSCPPCVGPFDEYIIKQDAAAYHGSFAANFIYNFHLAPKAENKFYISAHPTELVGHIKCSMPPLDTVSIIIKLYNGNAMVDSGQWIGTTSIANFSELRIPLTQNAANADSAYIKIQGGHKAASLTSTTQFWVDDFFFEKF